MFLNTWHRWLKQQAQLSAPRPRKRARSRSVLKLEMLEQRMAPAVVAVVTSPIDENDAYFPPPGLPAFPPVQRLASWQSPTSATTRDAKCAST